ncbi:MAG: TlpA family protein disulfide reductase [Thiomargarita sp.]|nr:TlpA family protein disulfide reductase [Thiomargarita sp.]
MKYFPLLLILCFTTSVFASDLPKPAPDFTLSGTQTSITLKQFKGKVVLLDFWASWCGPCRQSFPWMNAMQKKYQSQGFEVLAINLDKERSLADAFLKKLPANFTIAFDPKGTVATQYQLQGMPISFMIDKKGVIRKRHIGFHKKKVRVYEAGIRKLLKE